MTTIRTAPCRTLPWLLLLALAACPNTQQAYEIPDAAGPGHDAGADDLGGADAGADDLGGSDAFDPACDSDDDTYLDESCGGSDCDDDDFAVHPGAEELCSFVDENCNQQNNEGLDCSFLAATSEAKLYKIDPFAETFTFLSSVNLAVSNHGLLDIDIDNQGRLLAVTQDGLYLVSESGTMTELQQVTTPERTNGMAIDSAGTIYLTNNPYSSSDPARAYTVDGLTGAIDTLGELAPYRSSGDCVTLKDDSLLMTAPDPNTPYDPQNPEAQKDLLVFVNSATAATTLIGNTGYAKIYGLSASFNYLFGVTATGKVLQIDSSSGQATLLFEDSSLSFYGAANGD